MLYIATEEVGDVYTLFPERFIAFYLGCTIRLFFSYVNSNVDSLISVFFGFQ